MFLCCQIGAQPVEHRHKVVADALDARSAQPADVFAVGFDVFIARRLAELNVLVYGHAFYDLEGQTVRGRLRFDALDAFCRPDAARGDVVDGGNNSGHARNL